MANILPRDLEPAESVPSDASLILDNGVTVVKATPAQIADAGRPNAGQAEAEAGENNEKGMTPLRTRQAIMALSPLTSGNVAATRADLEAFAIEKNTAIYDLAPFKWMLGDYTAEAAERPDDYVESDHEPLTVGAWVRQGTASIQSEYGPLDEELARIFTGSPDPRRFGVVGDGETDDTAAWQEWIDWCAANEAPFHANVPCMVSVISDTLTIPLVKLTTVFAPRALPIALGNVSFAWAGPRNRPGIDIGEASGAASYYLETEIELPHIHATGTLQWPGGLHGRDIGIRVRQAFRCRIKEGYVSGFTTGIQYCGAGYNNIAAQHISDCRFGVVFMTDNANINYSFCNDNVRIGGRISYSSTTVGYGTGFHMVFTWNHTDGYRNHNNNRFIGTCFESSGTETYRVPIYFDGVGITNHFLLARVEGCAGPLGIADGGGGLYACDNIFEASYIAFPWQEATIRQVNGACGNQVKGVGVAETSWHSGDMGKIVKSYGAAGTAHITGKEFFFVNAGTPTFASIKKAEDVVTTALIAHRSGIALASGGFARVGVAIDTSRMKDFICSIDTLEGFHGRLAFMAFDATGGLLTSNATETLENPLLAISTAWAISTAYTELGKQVTNDSNKVYALVTPGTSASSGGPTGTGTAITDGTCVWKYLGPKVYPNEYYVKGMLGSGDGGQFLSYSGNTYRSPSDEEAGRVIRVTVRDEVKMLIFTVTGSTGPAVVRSMSARGFATLTKTGSSYPTRNGRSAIRVFSPLDTDGETPLSAANPATAGTIGYYQRGKRIANSAAASGATPGWVCTTSGFLAPAWVASTVYTIVGRLVTNDSGKIYELTTAGTAAGSGGPTGTTATFDGITDGTAKWRYVGVLATFVAEANLP